MKPAFLKNFTPGASKYRNKKIEVDGITFDSKKEAKVYSELTMMKQAGEIADFSRQVTFELVPPPIRNNHGKEKEVHRKGRHIQGRFRCGALRRRADGY
jgi:hypothetical protein